ncbi:aminodeoxychorismate lyase [Marinicella pacifica]|uniref:Aminodeoxychorismate lyase n=1 Tax=Marinicella pacifica TaxID=1171543 RepID=A0A917FMV5_9GAMM|nr:aminotransferase class IV [Marinicella pacifica]GGF90146.1 aminodeoxychorismate lyase [Marinicella pacifica]
MIIGASFNTGDISQWENRCLMYGDGVFETMRYKSQRVALWPWHVARLQKSLAYLQMDLSDLTSIENCINEQTDYDQSVLRLTVFRQQSQRGYPPVSRDTHWLISRFPFQAQGGPQILGLAGRHLSPQPLLKGLKHLNRLPQILIAAELNGRHVDDLLVCNQRGDVIETTCQNLLVVKDGQLYTPDTQDCGVNGVALSWLNEQLPIETKRLDLTDIKQADAIMTANAVHGFRTVSSIKTLAKFQTNHPICDRISRLWQQLID